MFGWDDLLLSLAPTILGGLFGGGQQQAPQPQAVSSLNPQQTEAMQGLWGALAPHLGTPQPTANQNQAMATVADLLGNMPTFQQNPQVGGALSTLLAGQPAAQINPGATQNFFDAAIKAPALQRFKEEIIPAIREDAVGTGNFWSTARAGAEGKAASDLAAALMGQQAQLAYSDEQARRQLSTDAANRQLGALAPALQASQQGWENQLGGIGTSAQLANQLFNMDTGLSQQDIPYIQAVLQMLGIPALAMFAPGQQVSPFAQGLGLSSQILSGMFQSGQGFNLRSGA